MSEIIREYEAPMQSLLNRVNAVTAYQRHGVEVPEENLIDLSERQIDVEKKFNFLKACFKKELEK